MQSLFILFGAVERDVSNQSSLRLKSVSELKSMIPLQLLPRKNISFNASTHCWMGAFLEHLDSPCSYRSSFQRYRRRGEVEVGDLSGPALLIITTDGEVAPLRRRRMIHTGICSIDDSPSLLKPTSREDRSLSEEGH